MKTNLHLVFFAIVATMASCTKDACDDSNISDATVSSMATSTDDFVYMRSTSAGDNSEWKIKMNSIASKAYSEGSNFYPANSMIVKEKHNASGKITGYDILYKAPADKNSIDGWLWTQVSGDGHVIYNSSERGASCQSCHAGIGKH